MTERKRLNAAERREQIVEAAREVFTEQGAAGARSREIALRAGITEAYLYRHFRMKEDLYRAAVQAPLEELIERLKVETHRLANQEGVRRADVLLRTHEIFLSSMAQLAPLLASALFSDPDANHEFYSDYLFPQLRDALETIIPDITGYVTNQIDVDIFVEATMGIHLTIALDHLIEGRPLDVEKLAAEITDMFAPGVGGDDA
jgi:AcrR family transcriptional regulator